MGVDAGTVAAAPGAIAALATGIVVKQAMKGDAYGGEDIAVDLAQGTAEAFIAVATAGTGEAALSALARTPALRRSRERPKAACSSSSLGVRPRGAFSGLPSGMVAAMLDENTWKSGNPL